jgi:pimeloyl-ACP methyl ester carboxylesterase
MNVNTATSLSYLTGFFAEDDVATLVSSKVAFVDSCFNNPAGVPAEIKWAWLGSTVIQLPPVSTLLLSRPQDPSALYAAGARGLPLLMIAGTNDKVVLNDVIINATVPHFTNVQVRRVQGGSHAVFYDNKDEFISLLSSFVTGIRLSKLLH